MRRSVSATILAGCVLGPSVAVAGEVRVLLFHGSRPWTGKATARLLGKAGLDVTLVDSSGLAGLGGASIKQFLTDEAEPEPRDDITPAFERLDDYAVVIVSAMLPADQAQFFTAERIQKLQSYLERGGGLITAENVPAAMAPLLPVAFQPGRKKGLAVLCRVRDSVFAGLPETWPRFGTGRRVTLKPGAKLLVEETAEDGAAAFPHIASIDVGQGRSVYWNADWRRRPHFKQLSDWVYFGDVLSRLVVSAARRPVAGEGLLAQPPAVPPAPTMAHAETVVRVPHTAEVSEFAPAQVAGAAGTVVVSFANGVRLAFVRKPVAYDAFFPGGEAAVLHGVRPPALLQSQESAHTTWDGDASEAVETGDVAETVSEGAFRIVEWEALRSGGIRFQLASDDRVVVATMAWEFMPKRVVIGERTYEGFGERVAIERGAAPLGMLLGVTSTVYARIGATLDGHTAWRMACYAAPRGFLQLPFELDKAATTRRWQPFGTGQPFSWLVAPGAVYTEFIDRPQVADLELRHGAGNSFIEVSSRLLVGRQHAPLEMPFVWRLCSRGKLPDANAWLGMYQFLRKRYCRQAGWGRPQIMPTSTHTNTCTADEVVATLKAAKQLGFRWHKLPLCPSSIESLESPKVIEMYAKIVEHGLEPKPWSACAYTQGMDNPVASSHPEWLVRERSGKPMQYFDSHPVFDLNNPDYFKHYTGVLSRAIDAGMRHIYLDMGGAQTAAVNHHGSTSEPGLSGAMQLYEFLNEKGVSAGIEGMSPLVIDEFWFRKDRYVNHTGGEFAFVGMSCVANIPDHLGMDYFRLGMHDAFFDVVVSPYAVGMETVPGEMALMAEIGQLNRIFLRAKELVGIPFVQQTPFGTSWTSQTGAALFFWNPVGEVGLRLPAGWRVREVLMPDDSQVPPKQDTSRLYGIPHKTCVLISPR